MKMNLGVSYDDDIGAEFNLNVLRVILCYYFKGYIVCVNIWFRDDLGLKPTILVIHYMLAIYIFDVSYLNFINLY